MAYTPHFTWIDTSGTVGILPQFNEKARWLKKVTPSMQFFFDLLDSNCFGFWGPWF